MSNKETFKLAQNNIEYRGHRCLFNCPRDILSLRTSEYKEYKNHQLDVKQTILNDFSYALKSVLTFFYLLIAF
jgi:hypothetical protein